MRYVAEGFDQTPPAPTESTGADVRVPARPDQQFGQGGLQHSRNKHGVRPVRKPVGGRVLPGTGNNRSKGSTCILGGRDVQGDTVRVRAVRDVFGDELQRNGKPNLRRRFRSFVRGCRRFARPKLDPAFGQKRAGFELEKGGPSVGAGGNDGRRLGRTGGRRQARGGAGRTSPLATAARPARVSASEAR